MMMPDVVNLGAKFGHYSYRWQLEATYEQNIVNGDIDIRRNDMPGLCAKMDLTRIGLVAAYRIPQLKDLQIMGTIGQVVAGRNVGKSTFSISILQYIDLRKNKGGGGIPTGQFVVLVMLIIWAICRQMNIKTDINKWTASRV
jgi:hypothetical protein